MITGTSVANQAIRILTFLDDSMEAKSGSSQDDILMALYNIHKLSPAYAVITCPVQHGHFFYISENCKSVFGYSAEYMGEHFRVLQRYYSQIHPSDLHDVQNCMDYLKSFLQEESPGDYHKLRVIFHYRFLDPEGRYVYLKDEKAALVTALGKNIHYSLVRKTGDDVQFTGVKIELFKQDTCMEKIGEYKPLAAKSKLSAREADLVRLIKKGLTTKEIAGQLSISHNTVRNIKSKLFEKYSVNNTIELLNMTG
jgi:DNA-binding CsgD family transcriptional regulator